MDNEILFRFTLKNANKEYYICRHNFRIGDIVKIESLGCQYSSFKNAFKYFTNSENPTYFAMHRRLEKNNFFKIFNMAWHPDLNLLLYVKDRQGRDAILDASGVELVRQYPLRKGESKIVELDVIKRSNL